MKLTTRLRTAIQGCTDADLARAICRWDGQRGPCAATIRRALAQEWNRRQARLAQVRP